MCLTPSQVNRFIHLVNCVSQSTEHTFRPEARALMRDISDPHNSILELAESIVDKPNSSFETFLSKYVKEV